MSQAGKPKITEEKTKSLYDQVMKIQETPMLYRYCMLPVLIQQLREHRCRMGTIWTCVATSKKEVAKRDLSLQDRRRNFLKKKRSLRAHRAALRCFQAEEKWIFHSMNSLENLEKCSYPPEPSLLEEALNSYEVGEKHYQALIRFRKDLPPGLERDFLHAA